MIEVGPFLEELNLQPLLTRAAAHVFRWSNELGIAAAFPERFTDVIDFLDSRLQS